MCVIKEQRARKARQDAVMAMFDREVTVSRTGSEEEAKNTLIFSEELKNLVGEEFEKGRDYIRALEHNYDVGDGFKLTYGMPLHDIIIRQDAQIKRMAKDLEELCEGGLCKNNKQMKCGSDECIETISKRYETP